MLFMGIIVISVTFYLAIGLYITYLAITAQVEEPFEEVEIHTLYPDYEPEVVSTELTEDDDPEQVLWAAPRIGTFLTPVGYGTNPEFLPQAPVVSPVVEDYVFPETREERWSRIDALPASLPSLDDVPWLKPIEVSRPKSVQPVEDVDEDHDDDSVKGDYKNDNQE